MSDFTSFLFQNQNPPPLPSGSDTSTAFPLWLQQYLYDTLGSARSVAGQPYQGFPGPTVAEPTQDTQDAWSLARGSMGAYKPFLQESGAMTRAAGAPISPEDIQRFLNPYQEYVTGALNKNLNQNLLPDIQDRFVGAGQSRSPQEAQITSNALADTQNAVGTSMAGAYQGAMDSLLRSRAQQMGAGSQLGQLGAMSSELGAFDFSNLGAAGAGQDQLRQSNLNAALGRFLEERDWPYQQVGFMSNIARGLPVQAAGSTSQTVGAYYPQGTTYNSSPFNNAISSIGGMSNIFSGGGGGGGTMLAARGGHIRRRTPARGALSRAVA